MLVGTYTYVPIFLLTEHVVASGTVKKVIEINPYLLGTMADGAGQCSFRTCEWAPIDCDVYSRLPILGNIPRYPVQAA